jgi:hypothetical protein
VSEPKRWLVMDWVDGLELARHQAWWRDNRPGETCPHCDAMWITDPEADRLLPKESE